MDCMQFSIDYQNIGNNLVSIPQAVWIACNSIMEFVIDQNVKYGFNTASGMDCMQFFLDKKGVLTMMSFNTASGMDCMQ